MMSMNDKKIVAKRERGNKKVLPAAPLHPTVSGPLHREDLFLGKIKTRVLPLPRLPTSSLELFCHLKQFGILSLCRMLETGFDVSEQISALPFERSIFTRRRTLQLINV